MEGSAIPYVRLATFRARSKCGKFKLSQILISRLLRQIAAILSEYKQNPHFYRSRCLAREIVSPPISESADSDAENAQPLILMNKRSDHSICSEQASGAIWSPFSTPNHQNVDPTSKSADSKCGKRPTADLNE